MTRSDFSAENAMRFAARWTLALALAGAIFLAMASQPALAQEVQTTRQMTALKPAAANRVIRSDLLSVFQPVDEISSGNRVRLRSAWLTTRAYGTAFDGLCRHDTLRLMYAPTDLQAKPRDQPLQPYGVEAAASFHATRVPTARPDNQTREDVWSESCDRLTEDKDAVWFSAKDAEEAARAVNVLKAATDQVKARTLKPVPCFQFPDEKRSCEQFIQEEVTLDKINSVEGCPAEPGMECYDIVVGWSIELTIAARRAENGLSPISVQSIKVDGYIIVT